MARIEDSVTATSPGIARATRNQMIRSAQREGLFLGKLWNLCASRLSESERELDLTTALLMAHYTMFGMQSGGPPHDMVLSWREGATSHYRRLLELRAAVRLIETEYFDATPLLFRGEEEHLDTNISEMAKLRARFDKAAERIEGGLEEEAADEATDGVGIEEPNEFLAILRLGPGPTAEDVEAGARRQAWRWVSLIRAKVLDDMGEPHQATAILNSIILEDEDSNDRLLPQVT